MGSTNNNMGDNSNNKFGMNPIAGNDNRGPSNRKNGQMERSGFDTEEGRGRRSFVPPFIPDGLDREPPPSFRSDGNGPFRSGGGDGRPPFRPDDVGRPPFRVGVEPPRRPPVQPNDPFQPNNGANDRWEPRRPPISSDFEPPSSFERPGDGLWEPRRPPMGASSYPQGPPPLPLRPERGPLPPRGGPPPPLSQIGPPPPRGGERPPPFKAVEGPPTVFRSDGNMGDQRRMSDDELRRGQQQPPPRPRSAFESDPQQLLNRGSPMQPDREDDDYRGPMRGSSRPQASLDGPPMDDYRGPMRGSSQSGSRRMDSPGFPRERQPDNRTGSQSGNRPPNVYDLAVIGAGVVGVQAALTAMQDDPTRRVVLIDAPVASGALQAPDGQDLSIGAPTGLFSKALRDTSKRINVQTLRGMGLREDSVWNEIISSCLDLARNSAEDMERQLDVAGVDRVKGYASFPNSGDTFTLQVRPSLQYNDAQQIKAAQVLIATGSKPFLPSGVPFDGGRRVLDSDSINRLSYLPKSIAITGSGIIAVEYAKIFRNLGAAVTLIIRDQVPRKALEKIGLDKDVAATLVADLVRSGIRIERNAQVGEFDVPENPRSPITIELRAKGGGPRKSGLPREIKCSAYLAAVGRTPCTQNLNLKAAGIEVDEYGGILVDSNLCTTAPSGNVFAAGDVLGRPFLASTGTAQGRAAVTSMFMPEWSDGPMNHPQCDPDDASCVVDGVSRSGVSFDPASLASNPFAFPTGVWSSPEAAYYGLTKEQAQKRGINAGESMALYAECLRGRVFSPNGLLKLVFEKPSGRILGIHICGDDACELIHYGMELIKSGRTVRDLNNSLYSAVTFHEMYKIAAQNALDEAGARTRRAAAGRAVAARQKSRAAIDSLEY